MLYYGTWTTSYLIHHVLLVIFTIQACFAKAGNPILTSTDDSVTLTFDVDPTATNYTATFIQSDSIFLHDITLEPTNVSRVSITYGKAVSGNIYTVELYENTTTREDKVFTGVIATVPLPPVNVKVMDRGSSFLFIEWGSVFNTSYSSHNISLEKAEASSIRIVQGSSDTFFNLTDLDPGFKYDINVQAISFYPGGYTKGNYSQTITNYTLPSKPVNLTAEAVNTSHIYLTWMDAPGSQQDMYQIQYFTINSSDMQDVLECSDSPCSFVPGPPAGQNVTVIVFSLSNGLASDGAQIVCSTDPGIVNDLKAIPGVRSLAITWTPPTASTVSFYTISFTDIWDNQTKSYKVQSSVDDTQLRYLARKLRGGTAYRVSVTAETSFAKGKADINVFYTVPEPVSNLSAEALNTTTVLISWENPNHSEIEEIEINVERAGHKTLNGVEASSVTSREITGLIPGELYHISVTIAAKTQMKSESKNTTVNTKPVVPRLVSSLSTDRSLTVTIEQSINEGVFDDFTLILQEDSKVMKNVSTPSKAVFDSLVPGTSYQLIAYTVSGLQNSEPLLLTLYTRPRPPQHLIVETINDSTIHVKWNKPDEGGFDNFTVVLRESEEGSPPQELSTEDTQVDFKSVTAGTMHNVTVKTVKGDQTSIGIMGQNTTAPLRVKDIRVWVRGVKSVTLVWNPPVASALDGYALTFAPSNITLLELPANVTIFKLENLKPETDFSIEIFTFALRPDGIKVYSQSQQLNFSTYPESVAALQKVDATSDSITVNWTAPDSGYFNRYQLGLREDSDNPQMYPFLVPRSQTNMTFENLKPGQMYTIAIRTVLQLPQQTPRYGISIRLAALTKPLPVMETIVVPVNTSAVTIFWTVNQTSQQNSFLISYGTDISIKTVDLYVSDPAQQGYELIINQLLSGAEYHFEIVSIRTIGTDSEESTPIIQSGFTVPIPVSNLTMVKETRSLKLLWDPPVGSNWDGYQVTYQSVLRSPNTAVQIMTSPSETPRVQILDLFPGEKYVVNVSTVSNGLYSDEISGSVVLDPLQPQALAQDKTKTTTESVTIGWTYNSSKYFVEKWEIAFTDGDGFVIMNETASEESEYSITLPNLKPGQTYTVKVMSIVLMFKSPPSELTVTAKPVITSALEEISTTNSSVHVGYTVDMNDIFDSFVFSIFDKDGISITKPKGDTEQEVIFQNLEAGTVYTFKAITVSRGEESSPKFLEIVTDPNPVQVNLSSSAREITFEFGSQPGDIATYTITCSPVESGSGECVEKTKVLSAEEKRVVFSGLSPFNSYMFDVVTTTQEVNGLTKSATRSYEKKTDEAAPSEVRELTILEIQLHSLSVSWESPISLNGKLRNYVVSYIGREPDFIEAPLDQNILPIAASRTSLELNNLKSGYEYRIEVFARTVADGPPVKTKTRLPTGSPAFQGSLNAESSKPIPPENNAVTTQQKLSLEFINPFNSERGYVSYYTVIVSRDPKANDKASILPSWNDVQRDKAIQVYQALERCEDFFTDNSRCGISLASNPSSRTKRAINDLQTRVFTIGEQTQEECNSVEFCNGVLQENTVYYIKLRAFTSSGNYSETVYSEPIRTADGSTSNAGLIGGLITGIIIILLLAGGIVFYMRRRTKPKRASKHTSSNSNWDQSSLNKFSRVVKLTDFADHLRKMAADSDFKYAEEYEDLKEIGRGQPTLAAEFPPNRPKNRFTNILPYDHSRVKLLPTDDEEGSDYINANYMPGYSSKREYIATQGPLTATRDDFWRMLWEQSSRNIVMLTKCQEKGREKSDHYWPRDMEPKYYGDLQVVILAETPMPDWTITELKVSLGEQSRIVRHFHYLSWPDFGVPQDPSSLIRFVRTVRERLIIEGGPVITHCSAGVGRSGTFIVLDHLLQLIREKDEVDIFSMVYKLRKERVLMVQTEQQYKFIHECLLCVLENREEDTTYANVGQINIGYEGD